MNRIISSAHQKIPFTIANLSWTATSKSCLRYSAKSFVYPNEIYVFSSAERGAHNVESNFALNSLACSLITSTLVV
jgi:hypothetical protein